MNTREKRKELAAKVRFTHFNLGSTRQGLQRNLPRGQATVAAVVDGDILHFAVSLCAPEDNFCRAEGRNIALKRLFAERDFMGTLQYNPHKNFGENCLEALLQTLDEYREDTDEVGVPSWYTTVQPEEITYRSKRGFKPKIG